MAHFIGQSSANVNANRQLKASTSLGKFSGKVEDVTGLTPTQISQGGSNKVTKIPV